MNRNRKTAFSLIELSIVLVLTAIIIAGVLSASTVSINNAKTKITNDRIKAIYRALGNFVLSNYRLPCPAALDVARESVGYGNSSGSAGVCDGAGVYQSSTQSSVIYGMVPATALGLPKDLAEDGFGNKMIYIVNKNFTAADYPSTTLSNYFSSFLESDASTINVLQVPSGNVLDGNAFVIMSLGQNKYGAFNAVSTAQNSIASSDIYEQQNYVSNVNTGTSPYSADFGTISGHGARTVITSSNPSSDVFDDIVFFRTRSQMVTDFNAMFLIPCAAVAGYGVGYYGQTVYRSSACTRPNTVTPSKKCVAYGVWADQQTCFVS